MLGFSQKVNAKMLLEKQFTIEKDYKRSLLLQQKQTNQTKGGHNKEIFMLNVETFKKFCLKAGAKKSRWNTWLFYKSLGSKVSVV